MMKITNHCVLITCLVLHAQHVNGHGRLLEPPGRGSLWRFGYQVAKNYNDNALNCGGFQVQWHINNGKCGFCGDPYDAFRDHETGGVFAPNIIPRTYTVGDIIRVTIDVTANHGGHFEFHLCPMSTLSQACFNRHPLMVNGEGYQYHIKSLKSPLNVNLRVQLPPKLTCDHCVLQWKWNCGQSYGFDKYRGVYCRGCGFQEQFYNCADITIKLSSIKTESFNPNHQTSTKQIHKSSETKIDSYGPYVSQFVTGGAITGKNYSRQNPYGQTTTIFSAPKLPSKFFPTEEKVCQGSVVFGRILDGWCKVNCAAGFCPSTHCICR